MDVALTFSVEDRIVVVLDAHAAFGGDDAALGFKNVRHEGQALHPVGLHFDHGLEGGRREPIRIGRHVVGRIGVIAASAELHAPVEFPGTDRGRAVEHHVLDEMGDARQPGPLVARPDPEERVQGNARDVVIFDEQDLEPVRQRVDLDVLLLEGRRERQGQGRQGRDQEPASFPHSNTSTERLPPIIPPAGSGVFGADLQNRG